MLKRLELSGYSMVAQMAQLEVITNNLANISTKGYKRDKMFIHGLNQKLLELEGSRSAPEGSVPRFEATVDLSQGPLVATGRPFDLAISGDGFFVVETPQGEAYTRDGRFTLNAEGLLIDLSGNPVVGEGGPVEINLEQNSAAQLVVNEQGEILLEGNLIDRLRIVAPQDPRQLVKAGANLFRLADESRPLADVESVVVKQGFLEDSNVNPMQEMVQMIDLLQHYRTDEKLIRAEDETLRRAANNMGRVS